MIIERPLETGQSRRKVYCKMSDLSSNGDGTYSFVNLSDSDLGFGSTVYVIDSDLKLMFDNTTGKLYDWT